MAATTSRRRAGPAALSCVALLRGINVGGKNALPMADLARLFTDLGCGDVRTYIQSGNVIFTAAAPILKRVPTDIPRAIQKSFGIQSPVVVRTADELAAIVSANPFAGRPGAEPDTWHVAFLDREPAADRLASLDPNRSPGDSLITRGRELYLHLPNGVARTKFTNAYIDASLGVVSTIRNWRTVLKLLERVAQASGL